MPQVGIPLEPIIENNEENKIDKHPGRHPRAIDAASCGHACVG